MLASITLAQAETSPSSVLLRTNGIHRGTLKLACHTSDISISRLLPRAIPRPCQPWSFPDSPSGFHRASKGSRLCNGISRILDTYCIQSRSSVPWLLSTQLFCSSCPTPCCSTRQLRQFDNPRIECLWAYISLLWQSSAVAVPSLYTPYKLNMHHSKVRICPRGSC